jgi:hypothetical protein
VTYDPTSMSAAGLERFSSITEAFPCLRGAPGVRPFDPTALVSWALDLQPVDDEDTNAHRPFLTAVYAVRFVCCLVNYHDDRPTEGTALYPVHDFDVRVAILWWDAAHRAAFAAWVLDGWPRLEGDPEADDEQPADPH